MRGFDDDDVDETRVYFIHCFSVFIFKINEKLKIIKTL